MAELEPKSQIQPNDQPPAADGPHVNRLSLIKGQERWNFRWDSGSASALINAVAAMARNPELPFDWFDAAIVCKHIAQPLRGSDPPVPNIPQN